VPGYRCQARAYSLCQLFKELGRLNLQHRRRLRLLCRGLLR
jgi:hypothetical protein